MQIHIAYLILLVGYNFCKVQAIALISIGGLNFNSYKIKGFNFN